MFNNFFSPIHKEGWFILLILFCLTIVFWHLTPFLGWIGIILFIWGLYFFRNPARTTPLGDKLIISPADGRLLPVVEVIPPADLALGTEKRMRLSIFMDVLDVHVNRIPIDGVITHVDYHKGKFINASLDKASEENERKSFVIQTTNGQKIGLVQIAGLVARRIKSPVEVGDEVKAGERFGIIKFGSRVDVYLPLDACITVIPGQKMVGGETVMADLNPSVAGAQMVFEGRTS